MYVYILYRKKSKKKNEVQIKQRKEKIVIICQNITDVFSLKSLGRSTLALLRVIM